MFSTPNAINHFHHELSTLVKMGRPFADPLFEDLFVRLYLKQKDIISAFSCEGHADQPGYVAFVCTPKGKQELEEVFYLFVQNCLEDDMYLAVSMMFNIEHLLFGEEDEITRVVVFRFPEFDGSPEGDELRKLTINFFNSAMISGLGL